jgi:integrase
MPKYIREGRNNWDAVLEIPKALRGVNGVPDQLRFKKSTGTTDRRKAELTASQWVGGWKLLLEAARNSDTSHLAKAIRFREEIQSQQDAEARRVLEEVLLDEAEKLVKPNNVTKAKEFFSVGSGTSKPSNAFFDAWKKQLTLAPKTIEQMTSDVEAFLKYFPTLDAITDDGVIDWLDKLEDKGDTYSSRKRQVGNARNFWKFLKRRRAVPRSLDPFADVLGEPPKAVESWLPFTKQQVVDIWEVAKAGDDPLLADLIAIGAYTGARIEELCSLKTTEVNDSSFSIVAAKTKAGIRLVPIHSAIMPMVARLKDASKDGYLISGLKADRHGKRANAVGKRFGRLKTALEYSESYVFHSIRKTLVTALENARVPENLAADIVGHDKPSMTYGLYSDGNELEIKREALEKVSYPFPELK